MKNITLILDGVADRKNEKLGGKTPLEYAKTKNLDALFKKSAAGLVKTIPDGLEIGSAVANLGLMGFDASGYRGRAIIEAAGLNMPINENDLYIRCNMVTFEGDSFEKSRMKSYSAFDIETKFAGPVAEALKNAVYDDKYSLNYCGSFRNILIVKNGKELYPVDFMPAHDIIGQEIGQYIRRDGKQAKFFELMERSYEFLQTQPTDINGVWFWGASIMPNIKKTETRRVALSETLLMDGITKITGVDNIGTEREGVTFAKFLEEKLAKSIQAAKDYDDIYVHMQETDDLSHELLPEKKAEAVELIDKIFLGDFIDSIAGDYALKIASDHFTFSDDGSHGGSPVPYMYYSTQKTQQSNGRFTEEDCAKAGGVITSAELRKFV